MLTRYFFVALLLPLLLIQPAAAKSPGILLTVDEPALGQWSFMWTYENYSVTVAPGQELDFSWTAEFDIDVGATITGYRYGWDVADFNDPDDSGWETGWTNVLSAPTRSFAEGTHNLIVLVTDDLGRTTSGEIRINVEGVVLTERRSLGEMKSEW